jgi:endo-1,4-beta-xylanase
MSVSRRTVLRLAAGGCAASAMVSRASEGEGLARRAARRGLSFGCMVRPEHVERGSPLLPVILREAAMLVPENDLKWRALEPARGRPDYSRAEKIVGFAERNGLKMRGHTAFWYKGVPDWAKPEIASPAAMPLALRHVQEVVGHFRGRIAEWDVVNEALEAGDGLPGGLRKAPFGQAMDAGYIADCFHAAREADPNARLYYNDFAVEYDDTPHALRRKGVLDLLAELKRRNAPIDGLGIQSHLCYGWRFTPRLYRTFLADVAATGVDIRLTEMDVADFHAATDIAQRDQQVADHARRYLDTALDEQAVVGLMCWGLRDRDSWMQSERWTQRADGSPERPLPYDDQLQRKPLWDAIGSALDNAPQRVRRRSAGPLPKAAG